MDTYYTNEINTQIVISLLKSHGIRKVIASPGTTNIRLVASMQQDSWFDIISAPDERSAAYIACGMAEEFGEPVVLSCTGATASRNYIPGLTEAFYRKLPIIAITSTQHMGRIGQNVAQVLDRTQQLNDMVKLSVQVPTCHTDEDKRSCEVKINNTLLECRRNGGGPVHINLETTYSGDFSIKELPRAGVINRYTYEQKLPELKNNKKIAVFVGAHSKWTKELTNSVNEFCEKYNAVVLCDHTSNYKEKYRAFFSLVTSQSFYSPLCKNIDLLIYIGNISGAYPDLISKEEWRVNPDGEIRDTFNHLTNVFEMSEEYFFNYYSQKIDIKSDDSYIKEWKNEYANIYNKIGELPFSNIWMAKETSKLLPKDSILHLGILNSLRSWNFFDIDKSIMGYSNTGGFGIDGILSTAIGAALASPDKLVFCVIGDLAFFYDMNSLGNHYLPKNLRILLINNGVGVEFKNYNHYAAKFGDDADEYIAAARHYGNKSTELVKHYSQDLGFEYMSASNKDEFLVNVKNLVKDDRKKPIILEAFTDSKDESKALEIIKTLEYDTKGKIKSDVKKIVKNIAGDKGISTIKRILRK